MEKADAWYCEICLLQFSAYNQERRPMLLECGHTFCQTCQAGFQGKCPKCRKEFRPDWCVTNFSLLELLEKLRECKLTESTFQEPVPPKPPAPVHFMVPVPFPVPVLVSPPAKETRSMAVGTSGLPLAAEVVQAVPSSASTVQGERRGEPMVNTFPYLN